MCGRTRCKQTPEQFCRNAGVPTRNFARQNRFQPRENVCPGMNLPVVICRGNRDAVEGLNAQESNDMQIRPMRWGLIPSFFNEDKLDFFRMFNARSEGLLERPSFKRLVKSRRCMVIIDGFYEWQEITGGKQAHYITMRSKGPMKCAALFDIYKGPLVAEQKLRLSSTSNESERPAKIQKTESSNSGEMEEYVSDKCMYSFTIVTVPSNSEMKFLHERQPLVLTSDAAQDLWLGNWQMDDDSDESVTEMCGRKLEDLIKMSEDDFATKGPIFQIYPVTNKVSALSYQGEDAAVPIKISKITNFFNVVASPKKELSPKPSSTPALSVSSVEAKPDIKANVSPSVIDLT